MAAQQACVQCGKAYERGRWIVGQGPTCLDCLPENRNNAAGEGDSSSSRTWSRQPAASDERTSSLSMIMPRPVLPSLAPGEMICRLEPETLRYLELSDDLRAFLGRTQADSTSQTLSDDLHPDDRALADGELRQVCEYGERNDLVFRLKARSGDWHYLRIYAQARYDAAAKLNHIRCNLKDVTDSVRAEQELSHRTEKLTQANEQLRAINQKLKETQTRLVQSEKLAALGTLAAGMAHEINNPLAYAINNTAVLQRDLGSLFQLVDRLRETLAAEPEVKQPYSTEIDELVDQMDLPYVRESLPRLVDSTRNGLLRVARIVEKLRGFARLDRASFGDVDVNESIDQCLVMLSESLTRLGIQVERNMGQVPLALGAGSELNQVFLNLFTNSIEAIEETGSRQGLIKVETRTMGGEIAIEITDNGPGIPPDILSRIFDPFFTTKAPGRGMGLGLAACHGIITKHAGHIDAESEAHKRTCFRIRLPVPGTVASRQI